MCFGGDTYSVRYIIICCLFNGVFSSEIAEKYPMRIVGHYTTPNYLHEIYRFSNNVGDLQNFIDIFQGIETIFNFIYFCGMDGVRSGGSRHHSAVPLDYSF